MGLTRKTSARPFETVKVRAQSGTLAARPTAGRGILGYICWAEDVETLYSCQLVAGVPTWVTVGPPTFDQVNAALALADQPIDINGVQLTSVLGIQMDQSTADVVGEIGMNAAGRILLDVSGTANSPVALLSDLAPVQPVQGLKPIADAAAIDETPNTSFFVNTSGAPMTVTASEIVANGTLTLAAGNANINLIKTLAAGGSSTIATLTPAASPGGDWAAGATVPFPAFSAVTLAAGDKLGYSITKNNLPAGVVVPSLLVAATTSYLSPLRAQGMKPIPDAAATDTVGNTRFYVNTTGAAVTVSSASLISNGALTADAADYASIIFTRWSVAAVTDLATLNTTLLGPGSTGNWTAGQTIPFPALGGPVSLAPGDGLGYRVTKANGGGAIIPTVPSFLIAITS